MCGRRLAGLIAAFALGFAAPAAATVHVPEYYPNKDEAPIVDGHLVWAKYRGAGAARELLIRAIGPEGRVGTLYRAPASPRTQDTEPVDFDASERGWALLQHRFLDEAGDRWCNPAVAEILVAAWGEKPRVVASDRTCNDTDEPRCPPRQLEMEGDHIVSFEESCGLLARRLGEPGAEFLAHLAWGMTADERLTMAGSVVAWPRKGNEANPGDNLVQVMDVRQPGVRRKVELGAVVPPEDWSPRIGWDFDVQEDGTVAVAWWAHRWTDHPRARLAVARPDGVLMPVETGTSVRDVGIALARDHLFVERHDDVAILDLAGRPVAVLDRIERDHPGANVDDMAFDGEMAGWYVLNEADAGGFVARLPVRPVEPIIDTSVASIVQRGRRRAVSLRPGVSCPRGGSDCVVDARIRRAGRGSHVLASGWFRVPPGTTRPLVLPLTARGTKTLRHRSRVASRLTLTATGQNGARRPVRRRITLRRRG